MANSTKKTQKELFNEILGAYGLTDEHKEFIKGRIAQLDKKSASKSDKPTATQKANAELKDKILAEMEADKSYTISDMLKALPSCAELSNQKISSMLRQLIGDGEVVRTEIKGKAYFKTC